tara:strand:+ start:684 stop:1094 length:411 start_codon:yes stop_codon:yes gene_type:complete
MADVTITREDVAINASNVTFVRVQVGEAVQQGQPLYRSSANSRHYKASATTATLAQCVGIAMTPSATDGFALMLKAGDFIVGGTVSQGLTYVVSATSGRIAPSADLASTNFVTNLGIAISSTVIRLDIAASAIALP